MTRDELRQNVDTIVIVIMENRSFDHVLGHLRSPLFENRTDVEGIEDPLNPDYLNPNTDGLGIAPFWSDDLPFGSDLPHSADAVRMQLAFSSVTGAHTMTGFVKAFEHEFHTSVNDPGVMRLLRPSAVPTTSALAAQYTVCDHWFACLPTSTAPNRLMSMCGYTEISETGVLLPDQKTVYNWLSERGVRWRVYASGFPFFTLMPKHSTLWMSDRVRRIEELQDLAAERDEERPQVIFIEPEYYDVPPAFRIKPPCDNHAPLPMAPGEEFLARIYDTLVNDTNRWSRTVFVVMYDEHGGCFDHIPPLPVTYKHPNGVAFASTGPRVPAIVAGPFAPRGVSKTPLDNTSMLQLLAERFGKRRERYSTEVTGRMRQGIGSVSSILSANAANTVRCNLSAVQATEFVPLPAAPPSQLQRGFERTVSGLLAQHPNEVRAKYPEIGSK